MIDSQFLTLFYELMIFTTRHDTTNIAVKQYSTLLVLNQTTRVTYNWQQSNYQLTIRCIDF